jgi:protein-tyrosine phosphatase
MLKPKGRNDGHNFDYSIIADKIYVGSDFCVGRECKLHSEEFNKMGVCVEINLAAEKKEIPPDDINMYAWLPVVDGYAPTMDQLNLGTSMINEAVEKGNTVYVHCKNGHGRSPTMVAAYLIRYKGLSVDEAIDLIVQKRPETHIEEVQRWALVEFKQNIS